MDGKKIDQLWHEAPEDREATPGRGVRGVLAPALFRTANKDIIDECRSFCNFPLPTEMLEIKSNKFYKKIKCNKSMLGYFNISVS